MAHPGYQSLWSSGGALSTCSCSNYPGSGGRTFTRLFRYFSSLAHQVLFLCLLMPAASLFMPGLQEAAERRLSRLDLLF